MHEGNETNMKEWEAKRDKKEREKVKRRGSLFFFGNSMVGLNSQEIKTGNWTRRSGLCNQLQRTKARPRPCSMRRTWKPRQHDDCHRMKPPDPIDMSAGIKEKDNWRVDTHRVSGYSWSNTSRFRLALNICSHQLDHVLDSNINDHGSQTLLNLIPPFTQSYPHTLQDLGLVFDAARILTGRLAM